MKKIKSSFVVYFEEPFFVGVFERVEGRNISAAKITFGAEPSSAEIYEFLLKNYDNLRFSKKLKTDRIYIKDNINPKRRKRAAGKFAKKIGTGTKAQEAIKKQYEQGKQEDKKKRREDKIIEKNAKYRLKKEKKKAKHRGK